MGSSRPQAYGGVFTTVGAPPVTYLVAAPHLVLLGALLLPPTAATTLPGYAGTPPALVYIRLRGIGIVVRVVWGLGIGY